MKLEEIAKLGRDEVLEVMRREGLSPVHSLFATIHTRSPERPDGWTADELDAVSDDLEDADLARWRRELAAHFAKSE